MKVRRILSASFLAPALANTLTMASLIAVADTTIRFKGAAGNDGDARLIAANHDRSEGTVTRNVRPEQERDPTPIDSTAPASIPAAGALAAFPGAQGHGALSIGGRGGRVIEVTNLSGSGGGSLRNALEVAEGPRIVVFRVGGTIWLDRAIQVANPYVTVAGQTAPGGGILLRGQPGSMVDDSIIRIRTDHVILRYLRLRVGDGLPDKFGNDNLYISNGHDIMVDHVSTSWSTDENGSVWRNRGEPATRITIQRSIFAEGIAGHSNGFIVGGPSNFNTSGPPIEEYKQIADLSIHHNLFAHNSHRNPRVSSLTTETINNVIYNWRVRIGSTQRDVSYDFVNNFAKIGPLLAEDLLRYPDWVHNLMMHHEHLDPDTGERFPDPSIYSSGNIVEPELHNDPNADDWWLWTYNFSQPAYQPLPQRYRRHSPLPSAPLPVMVEPARAAFQSVLADVGANRRLSCAGKWTINIDSVDLRVIRDVRYGTGTDSLVANPEDVGGYPHIAAGAPCADDDHDGMPTEWERNHRFNGSDPNDANGDRDGDGYTNIEEYLNGTSP